MQTNFREEAQTGGMAGGFYGEKTFKQALCHDRGEIRGSVGKVDLPLGMQTYGQISGAGGHQENNRGIEGHNPIKSQLWHHYAGQSQSLAARQESSPRLSHIRARAGVSVTVRCTRLRQLFSSSRAVISFRITPWRINP